jgi:Cu-processing system ATP-binding protein
MIRAEKVTKRFGKLIALDKISVECEQGQSISLIGPNGSGKTTFIKSILGMVVPDSGTILFDNKDIRNNWNYRRTIGYMPQIGQYPQNMTIAQLFRMMKDIRKSEHISYDEELLELFEIPEIMGKRMRTLSGGTRQKVSASLAFLFNPDVLILDEPTAGLDPLATEILKEKIRKEKTKGKLILITSHILSDLDDIVSEVIYMQDGMIQFNKSLKQLKADTGEENLAKAIANVMRNS